MRIFISSLYLINFLNKRELLSTFVGIELSITRCSANANRCVYNTCPVKLNLVSISDAKRFEILQKQRFYVPKISRICQYHAENGTWNDFVPENNNYNKDQIEELVDLARSQMPMNELGSDLPNIDKVSTGIDKRNFDLLLSLIPSLPNAFNGSHNKAKEALLMYLMRLRTGDHYNRISTRFGAAHVTVKKYIDKTREALLNDFVPLELGFANLNRESLLENSTTMARELYCQGNEQKVIIVADGTYIYCNKSQNYDHQRNTYSDQKKRNFIKPMVFVTTNGRFVEIFGPYEATKNDASIMHSVFEKHDSDIMRCMQQGDIFLLDRGFRDCGNFLENKGFVVKMPEFITKTDKSGQLTTEKANRSRLVTACRFVVETRNGHMKSIWKLFSKTWITTDQPHLMDDYRIGAALINKFFTTIESNKADAVEIATQMLIRAGRPNLFADTATTYRFQREVKHFKEEEVNSIIFPMISKNDFKEISLGSYQINQASPYCAEHLIKNGKFEVYVCPTSITKNYFEEIIEQTNINDLTVVMTKMHSRFRKKAVYDVFIAADKSKNGNESIIGYYCGCRHGLRTVGCCGHIMAIIAYLGYYRHNPTEIKLVAGFMSDFFES